MMRQRSALLACALFSFVLFAEIERDHTAHLAQEYCSIADHYEAASKTDKAIELYQKALSLQKNNPHALVKLGNISFAKNQTNEALSYFEQAIHEMPNDAHLRFNYGICFHKKQDWKSAAEQFEAALAVDHSHARASLYAAESYEKLNNYCKAIAMLNVALKNDPQSFEAHHRLGNLYRHCEQLENAIDPFKKALELQPHNVHLMMDLANSLNMLERNEESLEMYERILKHNPNIIAALYNFGFTLKKMDKLERALQVYQQVIARKPDYAPVHFSLSSIYLALGDYTQGWQEYEWRWKSYSEQQKKFDIPLWNGENLSGKRLLIFAEQGLGDTLQFVRYAQKLKQQFPNLYIVFETQSPLTTLLRLQPYLDLVVPRSQAVPKCDYQIPVMSIPRIVKTEVATIPNETPYLQASTERIAYWKDVLSRDKNFKIGLCWQGNARYSTQALRRAVAAKSIALEQFKPLSDIPGVSLYCLQRVDGTEQIESCSFKNKLIIFDAEFDKKHGSFMDTAGVVPHLDLIISVDTGLCHMAAGMNCSTWIILPFPADWRWLRNRSDSPWYPSVRLFRQPKAGDWHTPMQEIVEAIKEKMGKKKSYAIQTNENTDSFHVPTKEQQQFFDQLIETL